MLVSINQPLLETLNPSQMEVVLQRVDAAEVDEMWRGAALGRAAMSSGDDHDRDGYHVLTRPKLRE